LQHTYKVVANKFFIKIDNNDNVIIIDNNFAIAKSRQLKTKSIKNRSYFIYINIKSLILNASKITLNKDVDKRTNLVRYLIIVYVLRTKHICLYIRD